MLPTMHRVRCFEDGTVQEILSEDRFDAIKELVRKTPALKVVKDITRFEECVIQRERLQTTACGHGIAFAHGKMEDMEEVVICLGVSEMGIRFDSPDGKLVHLLFLIASRPQEQVAYLVALSALARLLENEKMRDRLLDARDVKAIEKILRQAFKRSLERSRARVAAV
jgi:mannitol/fructose-specific phosphotransferase system IIA component (Ntr-type)